jgi:hypothetical protein
MSLLSVLRDEKEICLGIARYYAPFETGNLRYNAIKAYDTSDGFSIDYDLSSAFYTYFLEEGTRYSTRHQGFIANLTYPAIASYINAKYADYNEDLINYYQDNSAQGNYDVYNKEQNRYGNYMLVAREERLLQSKLLDIETRGHMSNVYEWAHNPSYEVEQPNLNQKF